MKGSTYHQRNHRRGTVYLAVLGVSMIVGLIAVTASSVGRLTLRSTMAGEHGRRAARLAESGVDFALNWVDSNPDWRTRLSSGTLSTAVFANTTDNGHFQWTIIDTDGDLADDTRDHAVLRSIGRSGEGAAESVHVVEVGVEPAGRSLTCLEAAVHGDTIIELENDATLSGAGIASSNVEVWGMPSSTVNLDAEAVSSISSADFNGSTTTGIAPREMPGDHVFDWYVNQGTEIPLSSLTSSFGNRILQFRQLGRAVNPFGTPNPRGIYWIDCEGVDVKLRYTRLWGTLVLLNAGPDTEVDDVLLFQAEALNYPVLLVQGDLGIDLRNGISGQNVWETPGVNHNPAGMPYAGSSDSDSNDQYPARIDGIVYATGDITIDDDSVMEGSLIAENILVDENETLDITYRPYASNYPPPGFSAGTGLRILPGTWRRTGL